MWLGPLATLTAALSLLGRSLTEDLNNHANQ